MPFAVVLFFPSVKLLLCGMRGERGIGRNVTIGGEKYKFIQIHSIILVQVQVIPPPPPPPPPPNPFCLPGSPFAHIWPNCWPSAMGGAPIAPSPSSSSSLPGGGGEGCQQNTTEKGKEAAALIASKQSPPNTTDGPHPSSSPSIGPVSISSLLHSFIYLCCLDRCSRGGFYRPQMNVWRRGVKVSD